MRRPTLTLAKMRHHVGVEVIGRRFGQVMRILLDHSADPARPSPSLSRTKQKLVRKRSPPNIKFFPMSTRRMAWLLSGVVEQDDPKDVREATYIDGYVGGGGSGSGDERGEDRGTHANQEKNFDHNNSKRSTIGSVGGRPSTAGDDRKVTTDPDPRVATGAALAKSLAARKRTAFFLHQLLITVSAGGSRGAGAVSHMGCTYQFVTTAKCAILSIFSPTGRRQGVTQPRPSGWGPCGIKRTKTTAG